MRPDPERLTSARSRSLRAAATLQGLLGAGLGADRVRPLVVGSATTVVVMLLLFSGGGIWSLVGGQDLHGAFLPKYLEAGRALFDERRLPLWNPWELCGTPLFAVIQGLVLYLPAPLLFWLLPPYWALQGLYAVNLLVLAWGTAIYLRAHGIGALAAALAVLVTVDGVFMSYSMVGFDHPNFLGSVAWIPWILLAWERAVERGARPWLGLAALAVGAQWLAGYPDFPLDTAVLLAVIAVVSTGATLPRRLAFAVACVALGTALVAVQLVPLAEAVGLSFRAQAMSDYDGPRKLFAIFSSGLFQPLVVDRFGLAALALAALALWRPTRARLAWAAALVFAVCAGDPPISLLYRLPPFLGVRYALGWSHIAPLFVGFLVAAVVQRAATGEGRAGRATILVLALVVAGGCMWTIARAPRIMRPVAPEYEVIAQRVPVLKQAQNTLPGRPRIIASRETDAGMTVRERMASASGYDPTMPPHRIKRLIDAVNGVPDPVVRGMIVERNPRLAGLMGVGLVAVARGAVPALMKQGFVPVGKLPPNEVLLYRAPVPRARIVHRAIVAPDEETSFAHTVDAARDLEHGTVIETTEPLPELADPPTGLREDVALVVDQPERVEISATLAAPGFLVLTDTWYPGWLAEVDGTSVPILRADHAFRAVHLPAGAHRVVFRYAPRSLRIGLWISLAALLGVGVLLVPPRSVGAEPWR